MNSHSIVSKAFLKSKKRAIPGIFFFSVYVKISEIKRTFSPMYRFFYVSSLFPGWLPFLLSIHVIVNRCPQLSAPPHGSLELCSNLPGKTCRLACDRGYNLNGSTTRACTSDGTWTGTQTQCNGECAKLSLAKLKFHNKTISNYEGEQGVYDRGRERHKRRISTSSLLFIRLLSFH